MTFIFLHDFCLNEYGLTWMGQCLNSCISKDTPETGILLNMMKLHSCNNSKGSPFVKRCTTFPFCFQFNSWQTFRLITCVQEFSKNGKKKLFKTIIQWFWPHKSAKIAIMWYFNFYYIVFSILFSMCVLISILTNNEYSIYLYQCQWKTYCLFYFLW